jgi:hypothetical protein
VPYVQSLDPHRTLISLLLRVHNTDIIVVLESMTSMPKNETPVEIRQYNIVTCFILYFTISMV